MPKHWECLADCRLSRAGAHRRMAAGIGGPVPVPGLPCGRSCAVLCIGIDLSCRSDEWTRYWRLVHSFKCQHATAPPMSCRLGFGEVLARLAHLPAVEGKARRTGDTERRTAAPAGRRQPSDSAAGRDNMLATTLSEFSSAVLGRLRHLK